MFLVMIRDIDEGIENALLSSFASDTRLLKHIALLIDINLMQEDLNNVYDWTDKCNSKLNGTKFECMLYRMNAEIKDTTYYLTPDGSPIKCEDHVKDLGIIMSSDCNFNCHIEKVISSAKATSSWILRTFQVRERLPLLTLWKSLVLPIIEYCSVIWSPLKKGHIQGIEAIQ